MHSERNFVRLRSFLGFVALACLMVCWLVSAETAIASARGGLRLCAQVLIPTLFPFFVLSNLFVRRDYNRYLTAVLRPAMGPLFGLPAQSAGALVLGSIGGYPIGAATAFALYDQSLLDADETSRLLAFCNNAGPSFIFGVVGAGLFGSTRVGALLFCVHLLSALLTGSLLRFLPAGRPPSPAAEPVPRPAAPKREPFSASLIASVSTALGSILSVCAFVTFFAVLLGFLNRYRLLVLPAKLLHTVFGIGTDAAEAVLTGAVELSTGVGALGNIICTRSVLLSAASFLLGWGGACVHCQVLSLRGLRPISLRPYLLGKLTQGALAAVLIQLFYHGALALAVLCALVVLLLPALSHLRKNGGRKMPRRGV